MNAITNINKIDDIQVTDSFQCDINSLDNYIQFNDKGFSLITLNIRSIYFNFDNFLIYLSQLKFSPDVIILTECWLSDRKPIPVISGYNSYFSTRHFNKSDGVVVYVRSEIKARVKEINLQEATCLQIDIHERVILGIYRSPSVVDCDNFIDSLDAHLKSLESHKYVVFAGDININTIPKDTDTSLEKKNRVTYLNMISSHGLTLGHNFPTRENSSLDHVVTKICVNKYTVRVAVLDTSITDHSMIICYVTVPSVEKRCKKTRLVTDFEGALTELKSRNPEMLLSCDNPEVVTISLIDMLMDSLKCNTREVPIPRKGRVIKPWITPGILRCIRNRDMMQHKLKQNPYDEVLRITYRRYRNFCNNLVKKLKRKYERQLLQESVGDSKKLWENIGKITHLKKKNVINTELLNIKPTSLQSANYINNFFSTVGKNLADSIDQLSGDQAVLSTPRPMHMSSFVLLDTDEKEVQNILMSLKSNSAPGWDSIPTNFLKLARDTIVPVITHLCNLCFSKGVFPAPLKESIITPVYKGGDRDEVGNYRPISVLPAISKIMERLINSRLQNYLNRFNILSGAQYGFRSGRSTEDAVNALTSLIVDKLDTKSKCLAVFLDLKKAFDTVSVPILIQKMERVGIRGVPLNLFTDYLSGRTQRVRVGNIVSNRADVTYGVPQGSVLGPTLFLIYINELCDMQLEGARVFSYADDTAIVFAAHTWSEVGRMAEDGLAKVARWLSTNLLTLNIQKTNYMCFSISDRSQPDNNFSIGIHNTPCNRSVPCSCASITRVTSVKYLGVMLDQRLSWKMHIDLVSDRIRKLIWIFRTLRHVAAKTLIRQVYISLAQSIISYCLPIWGGALKTKFLEVERAQRALLKVMLFKKRRFSTSSLYSIANVLTVRKLYIVLTLLKKHQMLTFDPDLIKRRRHHNVAASKRTFTKFSRSQFSFLSTFLYNRVNKILNIYPLRRNECKRVLIEWLMSMEYGEAEGLLRNQY